MSPFRALFASSLAAALAACSSDRVAAPESDGAASAAATGFDQLADALARAGDPYSAAPFRDAAELVRESGRVTPITVFIDNQPTAFLAVAHRVTVPVGAACTAWPINPPEPGARNSRGESPPPSIPDCFRIVHRPNLTAWEPRAPHRLLLVTAAEGVVRFGSQPLDRLLASPPPATASLFDRDGSLWWATSGTGRNELVRTKDHCNPPPRMPTGARAECLLADYSWQLDITMTGAPLMRGRSNARPFPNSSETPQLVLAPTEIAGTLLRIAELPSPAPPPREPGPPPEEALTGSLDIVVAADAVTFTLNVTNPGRAAVDVRFRDAQQYDFVVHDAVARREIWRWSADKGFAQVLTTRRLQPGETATYRARWEEPVSGRLLATGSLTSSSHPLAVTRPLTIP